MNTQTQETLSRADAAWPHVEAPTNHFVVTSVALLDGALDLGRLQRVIERRVQLHPRLRRVIVEPALPRQAPRFRDDPDFDVAAHLHHVALPPPGGKRELEALIGDLAGQPLDPGRALWQLHVVEGLETSTALVSRFHHSLGDGQAMVRLLLSMTDESASGWTRTPRHLRHERSGSRPAAPAVPDQLTAPALLGAVSRLTLLDADPLTPLKGPLGLVKRTSWCRPISQDLVKRIAAASGTTVNDVLMSTIAGVLGVHLRGVGRDSDGLRIRAMVPVRVRGPRDTSAEGNRFSLVFVELPVGVRHTYSRLMQVKIEMDRIMASLEPAVGWLMIQGFGFLTPGLVRLASAFYASKASLVVTNVVGPRHRLYLAGRPIREMAFWEPESGGLGVGVSIFSYAGKLTLGVVSDSGLVAEPARITDEFPALLGELARACGVRRGA